ncbi:MAG: energy-coupling factor transporter transmembrane protein EcfT [Anaerolineaceae bacterium]|nr:energy-coupling factor transporter transmembrane protein EcfT [Anaerolineaceae bacterium]
MTVSFSWVAWLLANLTILLTTRNPLMLGLILALLLKSGVRMTEPGNRKRWLKQNLSFIGTMLFLSSLINLIFTHSGNTALFSLPDDWFLIGGDFTLESLLYGTINGLVISSLYLTFTILNKALSVEQLTRLIPNAFYPLTLIATIALTFFPSIQERTAQIKEAQMIRGNPMKNLSDWLPILIPLMVTSLENAVQLSESMTSRGFQAQTDDQHSSRPLLFLILATFMVFSGWLLSLFNYPTWLSWSLFLVAGLAIILLFFTLSKRVNIVHLHQSKWRSGDYFAVIFFCLVIALMAVLIVTKNITFLSYSPYPTLEFPSLNLAGWLLGLVPGIPLLLTFYYDHD